MEGWPEGGGLDGRRLEGWLSQSQAPSLTGLLLSNLN